MSSTDTDLDLIWVGPDGSEWDWMGGTNGVILGEGLEGVLFPQFEQLTTSMPTGRRYHGTRYKAASINATLQVADTVVAAETASGGRDGYRRGKAWRALDRRVRQSLSPTTPGTLMCRADGEERFRSLRLEELDYTLKKWPDIRGIVEYDIELVDDSPFWRGREVIYDFPYQTQNTADYYGREAGVGPDLYISASNNTALGVNVNNPGDVEAWPTWVITGPVQASVGFGDSITQLPYLAEGETLTLVTDPIRRSITDAQGNRAWSRVPNRRFIPVPAGDQLPITVATTDSGPGSSVRLSITPNYLGAY